MVERNAAGGRRRGHRSPPGDVRAVSGAPRGLCRNRRRGSGRSGRRGARRREAGRFNRRPLSRTARDAMDSARRRHARGEPVDLDGVAQGRHAGPGGSRSLLPRPRRRRNLDGVAPSSTLGQTQPEAPANTVAAESKVADARSARAGMGRGTAPSSFVNQRATSTPAPPAPRPAPAPMPVSSPTAIMRAAVQRRPRSFRRRLRRQAPGRRGRHSHAHAHTGEARSRDAARIPGCDGQSRGAGACRGRVLVAGPAVTGYGTTARDGRRRRRRRRRRWRWRSSRRGRRWWRRTRAPGPANRAVARVNWRVLASGQVERSVTGAATPGRR